MTYSKPEVQVLGDAIRVIQRNRKSVAPFELISPIARWSPDAAYDVDE